MVHGKTATLLVLYPLFPQFLPKVMKLLIPTGHLLRQTAIEEIKDARSRQRTFLENSFKSR